MEEPLLRKRVEKRKKREKRKKKSREKRREEKQKSPQPVKICGHKIILFYELNYYYTQVAKFVKRLYG